jgi:hypothetical protein
MYGLMADQGVRLAPRAVKGATIVGGRSSARRRHGGDHDDREAHPSDPAKLRLAAHIPALSPGWQDSFRELLTAAHTAGTAAGTTSLAEPAWAGFRTLCVTDVLPETATVSSIHLVARTGARSHPPGPDGT